MLLRNPYNLTQISSQNFTLKMNQIKQTNLREEIKAPEINSTSTDQKDSQQEMNNLS